MLLFQTNFKEIIWELFVFLNKKLGQFCPTTTNQSLCQSLIITFSSNFIQPIIKRRNDLIVIGTNTKINSISLSNVKRWTFYKVENQNEKPIQVQNNPSINYAELVLQPKTLDYGLYRFVYTVTLLMTGQQCQIYRKHCQDNI